MGPILAARIIGTVGVVARFPTKAHFASYSGTAPVETSSGEVVRHRLSLAGNRKLNYALLFRQLDHTSIRKYNISHSSRSICVMCPSDRGDTVDCYIGVNR